MIPSLAVAIRLVTDQYLLKITNETFDIDMEQTFLLIVEVLLDIFDDFV